MSNYTVTATFDRDRIYRNRAVPGDIIIDFNESEAPGSASTFMASLASCKLVSLLELRKKYNMTIDYAEVLVKGETGRAELIEGTHVPISRFLRLEYTFRLRTDHSDEELREYLKFVNGACTMGNSLSEKIDIIYRIERI